MVLFSQVLFVHFRLICVCSSDLMYFLCCVLYRCSFCSSVSFMLCSVSSLFSVYHSFSFPSDFVYFLCSVLYIFLLFQCLMFSAMFCCMLCFLFHSCSVCFVLSFSIFCAVSHSLFTLAVSIYILCILLSEEMFVLCKGEAEMV